MCRFSAALLALLLAGNAAAVGPELPAATAAQMMSLVWDAMEEMMKGGSTAVPPIMSPAVPPVSPVAPPVDPSAAVNPGGWSKAWDLGAGALSMGSDSGKGIPFWNLAGVPWAGAGSGATAPDLAGVWLNSANEYFLVEDNRFKLWSVTNNWSLEGTWQVVGDRLRTYLSSTGQSHEYSYASRGQTLVLIDSYEQVLVFKRMGTLAQ